MKPYIMLYSETTDIAPSCKTILESTTRTFSIETNDDDYLNLKDWTTITETIETTDDSFITNNSCQISSAFGEYTSTIITRSLENDDTDYLYLSTIRTNTIESSDDDYIILN